MVPAMKRMNLLSAIALAWAVLFDGVEAQWVQDHRCARRLSVDFQFGVAEEWKHDQQSKVQEHVDIVYGVNSDNESQESVASRSDGEDQEDFWYSYLRGHSEPPFARDQATNQSERQILEEDPTSFMMRLHWEKGNCWQGERIRRQWCMACDKGDDCRSGDKLWTQFCDNSVGQKFTWIPRVGPADDDDNQNYGQLKLAYFNLCLERMTTNTYQLQRCDSDSPYQVLVGWHPTRPFELHPTENHQKCINQHHHPRPQEEIANTFCDLAAQFHTNLWEVYRNNNAGNEMVRLRRPQCSRDRPCSRCEGDCDSSLECAGDLICVQRETGDAQMPVAGCNGIPNVNADYCARPEDVFRSEVPNHSLRLRDRDCSADNPCVNQCEGNCWGDNTCYGTMRCFRRESTSERVPHCAMDPEAPAANYCYEPDEEKSLTPQTHLIEIPNGCTEDKPCLQCQGDCDNDLQCYGPLRCYQRQAENARENVPGCLGWGISEADYCYLPDVPTPSPVAELEDDDDDSVIIPATPNQETLPNQASVTLGSPKPLKADTKRCMANDPCVECEGDCDGDAGCAGSLVCFQRPWHQPYQKVPGCVGRGVAGADYCVKA
ncbi:receptor-like protein kinase [Seminavis robusta]|uniref:Receptor-like protein kinase n=1 Tax=Seminavis robusta TaxID=568900 RepID=A0A9N8HF72_9STRA|nr:receptor-like protein kinase [Seminavis robusta]|eukprot:Sro335_g120150.1 receptor-like protein kinase (602) ;mRNA; r:50788-53196